MPMVTEALGGIQAEKEAMYAITQKFNGAAEYRVAQAIKEEAVSRARRVNWYVVAEVFFAAVAMAALVWSLWR